MKAKKRRNDPIPIDPEVREIQRGLDENEEDGSITSEVDANGVRQYRLTDEGKERAKALFRSFGVDPDDKEAVERFIFGRKGPPKL